MCYGKMLLQTMLESDPYKDVNMKVYFSDVGRCTSIWMSLIISWI